MHGTKENPANAGWWARMPEGGIRRIWVSRKERGGYACRVEVDGSAPVELVTPDRKEALDFLGRDDLANSALRAADEGDEPAER